MKRNTGCQLCAALLALTLLAGFAPAAGAAETTGEYDKAIAWTAGLDETPDLEDIGFLNTPLYKNPSVISFSVESGADNGRYAPKLWLAGQEIPEGARLAYDAGLKDAYFDTDAGLVLPGTYVYSIYGYQYNDTTPVGVVTLTLTVGEKAVTGEDLDHLSLKTDDAGDAALRDASDRIRSLARGQLRGEPYSIYLDRCTSGDVYYADNGIPEELTHYYSFTEFDELLYKLNEGETEGVVQFTVYSDEHTKNEPDFITGILYINGSVNTATITYCAEYDTPVYFRAADFEALLDSGYEIDVVTFSNLPSGKSEGTVSLDGRALTGMSQVYGDELDEVCFTPVSTLSGKTVTADFSIRAVRTSTGKSPRTVTGTVAIQVGKGGTIHTSTSQGGSVALNAEEFAAIFEDMTGQDLVYVTFSSLPVQSRGTLYVSGDERDMAVNSTSKYYYDADEKQLALSDVYFAPNETFSGAVTFAYDGYGARSSYHVQGDIVVTVTAGELDDVVYSPGTNTPVTLDEADFSGLKYITFDTLPAGSDGTLYYNYSADQAVHTPVSAGAQYNTGRTGALLSLVTFVPAADAPDVATIPYTGYDARGNIYSGRIVVKTFEGIDTVISYSTGCQTAAFQVDDFTDACEKKLNTTLDYVQFALPDPDQGALYYGYGTTQQTPVSTTSKYLADTHLAYVSFLPRAGCSGVVTIGYTGVDTGGASYDGIIQITVTPPTQSSSYTDASESWIAPAADFLHDAGVYAGVADGSTMLVRQQITRGEVMQMIYNAFDLKSEVIVVISNFSDVPDTHPYFTAINAGNALGIAKGDQGMYRPDEPITRQDAMTLLYRAFTTLGLNLTPGTSSDLLVFGDHDAVGSYAVDALASMVKSGIIQGNENGDINPKGNLTRGEMSVMLYRAMTLPQGK